MAASEGNGRKPMPIPVVVFTLGYMALAVAGAIRTGNKEFIFYIAVMVVLIGLVLEVHRRVGLSAGLLWCLSVWGAAHMAGGLVAVPESWPINGEQRVLYSWWLIPERLKYDQVVHAFGFGATTWMCWQGLASVIHELKGDSRPIEPTLGLLTLCAAAGMGFGAMNEVIEFVATLLVPKTNVGGYVNTGWDLVSNLVGCLIAAVALRIAYRWKVASVDR